MHQQVICLYVYSDDPYSYENIKHSCIRETTTDPSLFEVNISKNWLDSVGKYSYASLTVFYPNSGTSKVLVDQRKTLKIRHELNPKAAELIASKQNRTKKVVPMSPSLSALMAAQATMQELQSGSPYGWTNLVTAPQAPQPVNEF
jgi:hypothetical protein